MWGWLDEIKQRGKLDFYKKYFGCQKKNYAFSLIAQLYVIDISQQLSHFMYFIFLHLFIFSLCLFLPIYIFYVYFHF